MVEVAIPTDHRVNMNKSEKSEKKEQEIVWGLRKIRNMKSRIVSIIVGAFWNSC